jgi:hypothetical protein
MTKEQMTDGLHTLLNNYAFPVVVAVAAGWMLRNDVLIPLTEEHRALIRTVSETQREIAKSVEEQTRLLYALQPKAGERMMNIERSSPEPGTN